MSNKDAERQKKAEQLENARRVDNLINLVENKTRSERHIEQHSDIGDPKRLEHVYEVQRDREQQIEDIKNAIVYGDSGNQSTQEQLESLKKNYTFAEGYINHNADHMDQNALQSLKEKQQNRKEQMNQLQ